ncbi:MAG TPA: shikimate dehydrogenase [Casimicrobiaceae bacterium]|nr:shikimate dehydrogenase [Casimicrobiaceae bacterium]
MNRGPAGAAAAAFIRGSTLLYPVLGSPVAQVRAPMLYNALFASTGLDVAVVPMEIPPEDYPVVFKALFRASNVPGAMVTIPHKTATVELLDDYSDAVRIANACNAVIRRPDGTLFGELFDGIGFVRAVEKHQFVVAGAHCLVVGAGGAGAAIAAALAMAGARVIRLHDTRTAHAEALAARLRLHFPLTDIHAGTAALAGFALVVNATPLGMEPSDPLPIDVSQIAPQMLVAEIVMKREITPMLEAARARGCRIVLGREMLLEQMPLYLDFFGLSTVANDAPSHATRAR